jgi:hypothetical protein
LDITKIQRIIVYEIIGKCFIKSRFDEFQIGFFVKLNLQELGHLPLS